MKPLGKAEIPNESTMKISRIRFERLKESLEDIHSRIDLLESRLKRIITIGIMLILILIARVVAQVIVEVKAERRKLKLDTTLDTGFKKTEMQNTSSKNTLGCILKIIGPVGMFSKAPTGVPSPKGLSLSSCRSFGPLPQASSEGFLVTFTPVRDEGFGEVVSPYSLLPNCSIFHKGRQSIQGRFRRIASLEREESPRCRQEWQYCLSENTCNLGIEIQGDLMTPEPFFRGLGILVSLKPTDEALRKGRNTKERDDENKPIKV
jgi:hypothetical protein